MTNYFLQLLKNIRFYILVTSFLFSIVVYFFITSTIKLEQIYGLTSLAFLYFALLIGPFFYTFKTFPLKDPLLTGRRAIGVSAFYFALLHASLTFFGQLGGFEGLGFLENNYLFAVILGFSSLCILFVLTLTSIDWLVNKMNFHHWKVLHRFVYLAGVLILIHALMLGTHFGDLSGVISQITFAALAFLLFLEAPRFDKLLFKNIPQFGLSTVIIVGVMSGVYFLMIAGPNNKISFDIHAAHKQLAKEAIQNQQAINIPGLQGDRTKRYTVSFFQPDLIVPNQDTTFRFRVNDASNGNEVTFFKLLYTKSMHLIITDSTLSYFNHIHPELHDKEFIITTQFPKPGLYHLYVNFQPFGGIEQQDAFVVRVGINDADAIAFSQQSPDKNLTKTFGDYAVTLDTHSGLSAAAMSLGQQKISFTLKDAKTHKPITTIKPYLGAFGHLTMINKDSFDYIHVHPFNLIAPPPNTNSGPTVDFLPIGIYGSFKPGVYRMFAEFNPDENLFTADFTVKINE